MSLPPLALLAAMQGGERIRMIRYSPGKHGMILQSAFCRPSSACRFPSAFLFHGRQHSGVGMRFDN